MNLIFGGGDIADAIAKKIKKSKVIPFSDCDVRDIFAVEKAIYDHQPDLVINCAGVSYPCDIASSNVDNWRTEIETNLIGSFNISHAATYENEDVTLIFLASVSGLHGKPNHSGYCASKAGVISLVQSLALEGYDAYAISPGRVNTKMREKDYPGEDIKTRLEPKQIADVILDILDGMFTPGDNVIIRKRGYETYLELDDGEPWRSALKIGEPKTF